MSTYYRTSKRFFKRPPEGQALYVNASGTTLVEHKPKEIGELLVIPTARYESNPRPIAGQDEPEGLEGRCRSSRGSRFRRGVSGSTKPPRHARRTTDHPMQAPPQRGSPL